ncbi:MAG: tetratricopeptide repeat protein [Gemmataceae bacterium]
MVQPRAGLGGGGKRLAEAIGDFTEALRLSPSLSAALVNRGIAHRQAGDRDKALADLTAAITADPGPAAAYYNRAGLLAEAGDYAGAVADLDLVLARAPNDVEAYIGRGRVHALAGAFDRAVADFLVAGARPGDPRAANNPAWLLATAGKNADPARAAELARQAVADGEDATRLDTLAATLAAAGRPAEAVELSGGRSTWPARPTRMTRARLGAVRASQPLRAKEPGWRADERCRP